MSFNDDNERYEIHTNRGLIEQDFQRTFDTFSDKDLEAFVSKGVRDGEVIEISAKDDPELMIHVKAQRDLKGLLKASILRFKHKGAEFIRARDGAVLSRSFEPCVAGRVWDWDDMEWSDGITRKTLVFQTDRGLWFVPCKTATDFKKMVVDYTREKMDHFMGMSMKKHGWLSDGITGYIGPRVYDRETGKYYIQRPDGTLGNELSYAEIDNLSFPPQFHAKQTPWEVSCA